MKKISLLLILVALNVEARDVKEFNDTLIEGVKKDIQTDNDDAFKKKAPLRAPASVEVESTHPADLPRDERKIEKMNIKQLGPSKW